MQTSISSRMKIASSGISNFLDALVVRFLRGSERTELMIFFARTMAMMLKSGVLISKAFGILEASGAPWSRIIWRNVGRSIQEGRALHASLGQYPWLFSPYFIQTVRVGELSGNLPENFENLALQIGKERDLQRKIKESLFYPFMVLILAVLLGILMAYVIFPKIAPLLLALNVELPLSTRILLWITHFIESYGTWFGIAMAGVAVTAVWAARQPFAKPAMHAVFLHAPIFKRVSQGANISYFCRSMGILVKSGLTLDEALDIAGQALGNFYYRAAAGRLRHDVKGGTTLSKAMQQFPTFFPALVVNLVQAGEESGRIEEAFLYLADFYEAEVDVAARTLARTVEPALLFGLGLVVAFLALSVITPIFRVTGSIGG